MTPAEGEMIIDLTNDRPRLGDGFTQGGIIIPNYIDVRNCSFSRGAVGGTANAITITLSPSPSSYQLGMTVKFIATASNSGPSTININGLGSRNIYKITSSGIVALEAGDLILGGFYTLIYDGTQFQLENVLSSSGIISVGQGDLRTSSGQISATTSGAFYISFQAGNAASIPTTPASRISMGSSSSNLLLYTLPGGGYGFYPRIYRSSTSAVINQIYITASPPYNLGDGEVGGFFFAIVNSSGEIISTYIADTPPWAYNGPTDIRATHKCPVTGKKFRKIMKSKTLEQIMDGDKVSYKLEEITDTIKNKDMKIVPHPFENVPKDCRVIMFDPMDDKIRRLVDYQNMGGGNEIQEYISQGKFEIGDDCKRCSPKGVHVHKLKYKYTKKF